MHNHKCKSCHILYTMSTANLVVVGVANDEISRVCIPVSILHIQTGSVGTTEVIAAKE